MVVYFSGTGNSKFIAKRMGHILNLEVFSLRMIDVPSFTPDEDEPFIIVFPVYTYGMPDIVKHFLDHIDYSKCFSAAIATCANDSGGVLLKLKKKYKFNHVNEIFMPNNYISGKNSTIDTKQHSEDKINNAYIKLDLIRNDILRKHEFFEKSKSKNKHFKDIIHKFYMSYGRSTANFKVKDSCIGCGECAFNCPDSSIIIENGRPVWVEEVCQMCLRCINHCPVDAIELAHSIGKKRYKIFKDENLELDYHKKR